MLSCFMYMIVHEGSTSWNLQIYSKGTEFRYTLYVVVEYSIFATKLSGQLRATVSFKYFSTDGSNMEFRSETRTTT
jgi:hypothetical protein